MWAIGGDNGHFKLQFLRFCFQKPQPEMVAQRRKRIK